MSKTKFYTKIKLAFITVLSLALTLAHWLIANNQLKTVGFAAGNRDPNYFTFALGYLFALIALGNIVFVFKTKRFVKSVGLTVVLVMAMIVLYFASW